MPIARRLLQTNLQVPNGSAMTSAIQIPNGATKLTIQFSYSGLDDDVTLSMHQSLDGINFDLCMTENDEPVLITLDHTFTSMTMNVADLLASWIKFSLDPCNATTGTIEKLYILMQ